MFPLLLACAEPFDVQRDVLGPFRIAAIGVEDGVAHTAIWSGEGTHASSPSLVWTLDGEPLGVGFDVVVPLEGELGLTATSADGNVQEARVSVSEPGGEVDFTRFAVQLGDEDIEARRALEEREIESSVEDDEALRVRLDSEWGSARWMSDVATVLPLEDDAADVVLEHDSAQVLVLVQDGEGGNRWLWIDAAVGGGPWIRHAGHLIDGDVEVGLVAGTVSGGTVVDLGAVDDLTEQDTLACAPADTPFELDWIVEGRCGLDEVDGARVVLETW